MKPIQLAKLGVIVIVIAAVAAVLRLKHVESSAPVDDVSGSISTMALTDRARTTPPDPRTDQADQTLAEVALPRLLDLGADKCIPCKKMAPILEALREDYTGQFEVVFIDVWKNRQAAGPYRIKLIPTQIFFDEGGDELFRHEGFFSREDILATWLELGYEFARPRKKRPGDRLVWSVALPVSRIVEELFSNLTQAVEGSPATAVAAAFVWGVLSIVLSPCHLASIPLIIGFISGQGGEITLRRACALSTLFSVGILLTIAGIGAITAAAGRMMGDIGGYGNYVVAVIFLVVGLVLLGVVPVPWSGPGQIAMKRKGAVAAFLLGLVFGIALGPCTFAYMAPMLAVTFKLAYTDLAYGIVLLLVYGVGHCFVIVLAGTCTEVVQRYLHWTGKSPGAAILRGACGVLVILGGLYLIYAAP